MSSSSNIVSFIKSLNDRITNIDKCLAYLRKGLYITTQWERDILFGNIAVVDYAVKTLIKQMDFYEELRKRRKYR